MENIRLFKVPLILLTLSFTAFPSVNAEVISFVEAQKIGLVTNHTISPNGKFIISTTISPSGLFVHARSAATGEILNKVQSLVASDFIDGLSPSFSPGSMVISPDSKQVYIAAQFGIPGDQDLNYEPSILRFDISSSGKLIYKNRVLVSGGSDGLTLSKNGRFMFVGDGINGNRLSAVLRAPNGNITTVQTNVITPSDGSGGAGELIISPDSRNLYGSSTGPDGHLHVYNINKNNGTLTLTQSFIPKGSSYTKPNDIVGDGSGGSGSAISLDGKYIYTVGGYGDDRDSISIFKRDNNGLLSFIKNVSGNIGNRRLLFSSNSTLAISHNQKFIYTFDGIEDNISVWRRNKNTGDLSYLGTIERSSTIKFDGAGEEEIVLSEDGHNLYLNNGKGILVFDLSADLSLVKTDTVDPVKMSGTINYTLAVTNKKGSDAQNVVITDTLPIGTSFVSGYVNSNTGSCSANGQIVTCTMGQILAGDGYSAMIKVNAPSTAGKITNIATVKADQPDTKLANNTDSETTNISANGTTTPTTPAGTNKSGGGSMPLGFLITLMSLFTYRRYQVNKNIK